MNEHEHHAPERGDRADADAPAPSAPAPPARLPLKKRLQVVAAGVLGCNVIRAIGATLRIRIVHRGVTYTRGSEAPILEAVRGGGPLLFAVWHGSCFPVLYYWRRRGLCVVTSRSTDGQILAGVLHRLGYRTVHGSSSRGGTRALIDLARFVRAGGDAAIAVDGPRGPAGGVKPGIILLAKLTGRPIVPLAATASRYWRFQSWDRFRLPLPFSRATIIGGEPLTVPPDAGHEVLEAKRVELEQSLRTLQEQVDAQVKPKVWSARQKKGKTADGEARS